MTDLTWRDANGISSMLLVQRWTDAEQDPPSRATLADIAAALAARGLCVVPKGRHDWVFGEEVMKRDEEIARLTAELATEKAAVADYERLWEELTNKVSELTAEQQRRQEVERDRDGWKRAAESQNRQWSKKCAQLTDVRAELERAERELASCRKVVEAALRLRAKMARDDEGRPLIDNFAGSDFDDLDGACAIYEIGLTHEPERNAAERAARAAAGKDSGEVNPPGIPESSNPSKSSNGSPEPAATVPRGEVEALWRHALSRSRCLSRGDRPEAGDEWAEIASAIKALLAKTEVNS